MKLSIFKLGQEISWLIERGDSTKKNSVIPKMMANKVAVNLYILGALM